MGQVERLHALLRLHQHRRRDIDAAEAVRFGILRQRNASADADLENAAADPLGRLDREGTAALEHRSEYQIINRRPPGIGLGDGLFVEFFFPECREPRLGHEPLLPALPAPTPLPHRQFLTLTLTLRPATVMPD